MQNTNSLSQAEVRRDFFVEGVHCANCLKKIDKASNAFSGVKSSNFNMSSNTLTVWLSPEVSPLRYADEIASLGFKVTPLESGHGAEELSAQSDRMTLLRLGVAAFGASNIMLLSIASYAGAIGELNHFFNYLSCLLALPVLTFSAWPIYKNSWFDIVNFKISVDLPIALALASGMLISGWGVLNSGDIYFDSMTALVFLLLASRYLLSRVQKHFLQRSQFQSLLDIQQVARVLNEQQGEPKTETIWVEEVRAGDKILVKKNEIIPVDGRLVSLHATVSSSLLTGEPRPQELLGEADVFLGMLNIGDAITVQASIEHADSRLHQLLEQVVHAEAAKSRTIEVLDRVGQWFLIIVIAVAILTFAYFASVDPAEGIKRALAFLLVTCPCTFAFAVPLVYTLTLNQCAKLGILVKHPSLFEKVNAITRVLFDKTGTITDGQYEIQSVDFLLSDYEIANEYSRLLKLCLTSDHPVSRAWVRYLRAHEVQPTNENIDNVKAEPAIGLTGKFGNDTYLVRSDSILKNNIQIMKAVMGDRVLNDGPSTVQYLTQNDFEIEMVSGDDPENTRRVAKVIGIDLNKVHSRATPETKKSLVEQNKKTLMVGDGANDSLALASAYVGIAVHGSLVSSLRAADAYFLRPGLSGIKLLIEISKSVKQTVTRNLVIAVLYNLLAGVLAIMGYIHPLLAAILMPLSSVTQLGSTMLGLYFSNRTQAIQEVKA